MGFNTLFAAYKSQLFSGRGFYVDVRLSDDKIFGKVTSVAVEFLCVFLIAGEIFYDLEYETNPDISDVGDALYWSFLTLTGIGQVRSFSFAYGQ